MAQTHTQKAMAEIDGEFVRVPYRHADEPTREGSHMAAGLFVMPRMLKELAGKPESGVLGCEQFLGAVREPVRDAWKRPPPRRVD